MIGVWTPGFPNGQAQRDVCPIQSELEKGGSDVEADAREKGESGCCLERRTGNLQWVRVRESDRRENLLGARWGLRACHGGVTGQG